MDKNHWIKIQQTLDESLPFNEHWTKIFHPMNVERKSNESLTNMGRKSNECQMKVEQKSDNDNATNNVTKHEFHSDGGRDTMTMTTL